MSVLVHPSNSLSLALLGNLLSGLLLWGGFLNSLLGDLLNGLFHNLLRSDFLWGRFLSDYKVIILIC
jgi:hypothetical protein